MSNKSVMLRGATALTVIAVAAGCAAPTPAPAPAPAPVTSVTATAPAPGGEVTEAQAASLCEQINGQISNWSVQGATIGRAGLNILVQQWAAQSGTINLTVIRDRAIIDRITTASCPDIRTRAISYLDVPDLASALVGF